jgi:hypothetical protein
MNRGFSDEAIVIVKFGASDFMVTWMRVKHQISDRKLEMKGGTRKRPWPLIIDWWDEICLIGATHYSQGKL